MADPVPIPRKLDREAMRRLVRSLNPIQQEVELEIMRTPTGQDRELLTEINIHLQVAVSKLCDLA